MTLEELQEKIQAALEQTEVYENQREKVQKQAEFCKSKAEQKKEQFSDDLYNGLMQDIDSFIRNDDRNGQCDIEAVKNALYADKEGIETVREQMHGLPKELTQENSMQAEEVLYNQCAAEYRRIKKCAECIQAVKEHNGGTDNGSAGFG